MTGLDPYRRVDGTSIRAILNPIEVIWTILLMQVADSVEKLVVGDIENCKKVQKV